MQAGGAEPEEEPVSWHAGMPVEEQSSIGDIISCLSFGSGDESSWNSIKDKFAARGIKTVRVLEEDWSIPELISLIRAVQPRKQPRAYLAGISAGMGRDLFKNMKQSVKAEGDGAAEGQGREWHTHCTKQKPSAEFNPFKYKPDGRVFAKLPNKGACEHLDAEEEQLVVDLLWIDAHVNPEPSLGDYLPSGVTLRLGRVCTDLLPPFKPTKKGEARAPKDVIRLRHQNARDAPKPYARMVLSDELKEYIQSKSRSSVTWVEPSSEALVDNIRNSVMSELVGGEENFWAIQGWKLD